MLAQAKHYLSTVLVSAGLPEDCIYTDAAQAGKHKRPPWASILTPQDREAETYTRLAKPVRLNKYFYPPDHPGPETPKTWDYIEKVYDQTLVLDVVIVARNTAQADGIKNAFLTLMEPRIYLDLEAEAGYVTDPEEIQDPLNSMVEIQAESGVWSDNLSVIRDEDHINLRVVFSGAILALESREVIQGVNFGVAAEGEELDVQE